MADNCKKEFGFTHKDATKQLNDKYRTFRKEIESIMDWENESSEQIDIVKARLIALFPIALKINDMAKCNSINIPINLLLSSIIHMTMNRWFRAKNRLYEMVIYEFLSRYYSSKIAKKKYIPQNENIR